MRVLELSKGLVALVDDKDFGRVSQFHWSAKLNSNRTGWYASRRVGNHSVYLHRYIMDAKPEEDVDHRDRFGLNNLRSNLRLCSTAQNMANQVKRAGTLYKGVFKSGRRWGAQMTVRRKHLHLGRYEVIEDAARAYDVAARQHFGEFARLNFPLI